MYERLVAPRLVQLAGRFPAVAVLGPRQVGKTTLARSAFPGFAYIDLEDPLTAQRFADDPRLALEAAGDGVVLDEAQAVPAVFAALRGVIDANRARNGRFIVLGSAQPTLVRGISESLAGRIGIVELEPLSACEAATGAAPRGWRDVWLKGGFPDALVADAHRDWWEAYLRTVLERDLPQYGVAADPVFLRRLLTMVAHQQGGLFNASALANSLGVSYHTVQRHVETFEAIFLLRRLQPWFRNVGKRLTKAPKLYLRDSGLLHHLLHIGSHEELASHPVRGASWEGFVIEDLLRRESVARSESRAWFWRTAAGAEIDLLLDRGTSRVAIEVKSGRPNGQALRVLRAAMPDVDAARGWFVDQARGVEKLGPDMARIGFEDALQGTP